MSTEKKKIGRPPEDLATRLNKISMDKEKIKMLYIDGWTDQKVADFLGISVPAIKKWKKVNEFSIPLKDWKTVADLKVEKCLYKRAQGFKYKEVTTEYIEIGESKTPAKKTKVVTKQLPPDPTSMIFWLKNRQPDKWRDKKDVEVIELTPEEKRAKLARIKAIIGSDDSDTE